MTRTSSPMSASKATHMDTKPVPPTSRADCGARRFVLRRHRDSTGISGTGIVAVGVAFADGAATMRWQAPGRPATTVTADCWRDIEVLHGHGGDTVIEWIDPPPPPRPRSRPRRGRLRAVSSSAPASDEAA